MLTGERLGAADAMRIGFVHECVPAGELDAAAQRLCARLAEAAPGALARTKKLLQRVEHAPLGAALAGETASALAEARASAEAREGIRSFLEKSKPTWQ
jgi:methylglutaconyl-CoA hydratase